MLFQALADHLGGLACLEILIVIDLLFLDLELVLIVLFQRLLLEAALSLLVLELCIECDYLRIPVGDLLLLVAEGIAYGKLLLGIIHGDLILELLDLDFFIRKSLILVVQNLIKRLLLLHPSDLEITLALKFKDLCALVKLLFKRLVPYLA